MFVYWSPENEVNSSAWNRSCLVPCVWRCRMPCRGSSGKRDTRRGMAVTRQKRRVCRGQSWEIVREMQVFIGKSSVNGRFHGKNHCKRRFSWENRGKLWGKYGKTLGFQRGKSTIYMSLFEEFEHCLKNYLLQSISPLVGWCSSGTFSRHLVSTNDYPPGNFGRLFWI